MSISIYSVCAVIFGSLVLVWLAAFAAHRAGRAGLARGILGCGAVLVLPFFLFSPPTASLLAGEWLLVGSRAFLVFQTLFTVLCALMIAAALALCCLNRFGAERGDKHRKLCLAAFALIFYGTAYVLPVIAAVFLCDVRPEDILEQWHAWGFRYVTEWFLPKIPFFVRQLFLVPDPLPDWYPENYLPTLIILCAVTVFPAVSMAVLHITRRFENKMLAVRRRFASFRLPVKCLAGGAAVFVLCAALFLRALAVQEAEARQLLVIYAQSDWSYVLCCVIYSNGQLDYCQTNAKYIGTYGPELLNSRRHIVKREYGMQLSEEQMNRVTALAEAAYAREDFGFEASVSLGFPSFDWTEKSELPHGAYMVSYKGEARGSNYYYDFGERDGKMPEFWRLMKYVFWGLDDGRYLLDTTEISTQENG